MPLFSPQPELSRLKSRYLWMLILMALVFLVYTGRFYCLQLSHGEEYQSISRSNFVFEQRDVALRGMIFDRDHRLLVDNQPSFNLYFTPAFCLEQAFEPTLARLTEYLGLSDIEIEETRQRYSQTKQLDRFLPMLVRRNISRAELAAVEQNLNLMEGVEVRPEAIRAYPGGTLAAHLLGYVGEVSPSELKQLRSAGYRQGDIIGKAGLEKTWEVELKGTNGLVQVVKDAHGQRVPESLARQVLVGDRVGEQANPGYNLILSIDERLQALAEKRFPGQAGAVVALDPNTGFMLSIMSRPTFDPNLVSGRASPRWWNELIQDPDRPLLNRVIQQHYSPGSAFKPFTGLAALEFGALSETNQQLCKGQIRVSDHWFRCWREKGHGRLAIHKAIVRSCDVFFYRAGIKVGLDAVAEVARRFGLGSITGFDPGREVPGIIPDRAWYEANTETGFLPGFTASDSIGQGDVNVTPLQLAVAYAAIANGGTRYRPQVVLRVESPTGKEVRSFTPVVMQKVKVQPENLRLITDGLVGVVNEPGGTAYYSRPRGVKFQVAGKTGTAQVIKQGADRGKDLPYDFKDHAWFVAYAPIEQPQIVVVVINEHGGHGSSGAAPLAMEIITYFMEQLGGNQLKTALGKP